MFCNLLLICSLKHGSEKKLLRKSLFVRSLFQYKFFSDKSAFNALNTFWTDFWNDYSLKHFLNYQYNMFFWGSWCVCHSKLRFLFSNLKYLKKKHEKIMSLIPGKPKVQNSNLTMFHTSWWYSNVGGNVSVRGCLYLSVAACIWVWLPVSECSCLCLSVVVHGFPLQMLHLSAFSWD